MLHIQNYCKNIKRIQKVLHGVIDQRQSAFLGGGGRRDLLHRVMVANKVMDEAKMKKK